jgi:hypothetical protein
MSRPRRREAELRNHPERQGSCIQLPRVFLTFCDKHGPSTRAVRAGDVGGCGAGPKADRPSVSSPLIQLTGQPSTLIARHRNPGRARTAPAVRHARDRNQSGSSPCLEMPTRSTLAGWLATGSMWRLADGQHGSDQVVQRSGQVLLGDQDNLVIDAKMVDRPSRNRAAGRQGGQGPCEEFLPQPVALDAAVSTIRRRVVPSGPIRVTTTLISSVCPLRGHFGRQPTTMAAGRHARPVTRLADCRKRDHAPSTQSGAPQISPIAAGKACLG